MTAEEQPRQPNTKMCVLCFNSQWRSVVIGLSSSVMSLLILLVSVGYKDHIKAHLEDKVMSKGCLSYDESAAMGGDRQINWTLTLMKKENECVFFALTSLFPWAIWATLSTYAILNAGLVLSALYKWTPGVTTYLAVDALYLGILATSLCLSFFPTGITRILLLTILFPVFSLALCAWMTVFGFYLRLEDLAKREEKKKLAQSTIEKNFQTYWGNPDLDEEQIEQVREAAARLFATQCQSQLSRDVEFDNLGYVPEGR